MSHFLEPEQEQSPPAQTALHFAQALARGEFEEASAMLAEDCAPSWSPAVLKARYDEMVSYWPGRADHCELVMFETEVGNLRAPDEIAWVYVSIGMEGYLEAVTVTVRGDLAIRIKEDGWGRP